jgi:hypothetical protein
VRVVGLWNRTAVVELSWHAVGYTAGRTRRLHPDELVVEGTEGSLAIGEDGQVRVAHRAGGRETVAVDTRDGYRRSWRDAQAHFAACLTGGAPFETPGEQHLATLRLVFDAYRSAASGLPVRRAPAAPTVAPPVTGGPPPQTPPATGRP